MSLILCPECGTKISDKAVACPHCGFRSKKTSLPISQQDVYISVPLFEYDIEKWDPNRSELTEIPLEDGKKLFEFFGSWKNIEAFIPAIADVIKSLAKKDRVLVADYDKYIEKLIEKGIYRFTIDKKGEILPTIRDGEKIVKQVRLKEMDFSPQLNQSLNNLAVHAQLAQILDEIEYVGDTIRGIHQELQNDRIALAESAWDKLRQARKIQDSRLRELAILGVVGTATDAKRVLMRNFIDDKKLLEDKGSRNMAVLIKDARKDKDIPNKAADAFQDIVSITNCVQIECEGFAMLGEYDACKESLLEFKSFILDNRLDDKNTLLRLNMNLQNKQPVAVDEFSDIAKRITDFDASSSIEYNMRSLLEGE